jgi:hypothetical protein
MLGHVVLAVAIPKSDQANWCWAAIGLGIAQAYGEMPGGKQCAVATRVRGIRCCPAGSFGDCDVPMALAPALGDHLDRRRPVLETEERTFALVKECIDSGHPLAVGISLPDAHSGHFVVVNGYKVEDSENHVYVCDPATGTCSLENFDRFVRRFKNFGSWRESFRITGPAPLRLARSASVP